MKETKAKEIKKIRKQKNAKGITLIALVITIIVLLILAGVSIATLTGQNGILTRAQDSKDQTEVAEEKEKVELSAVGALAKDNGGKIKRNYLKDELTSYIGNEGTDYTLSESETAPFVVKYSNSGRSYLIDENGNVSEYVDVSEYVKVGQYVNYNPTVSDLNGTPVEASKLKYTSPTGSGTEHGNGSGEQKFSATANTKWRVLEVGTGTVTLISDNTTIAKDDGSTIFTLKGAVGYLYAEQELNEICKICGYGYGADTSQVTEYSYGGPKDRELTGRITGSGARSLTREDINKLAGIYEDANGILRFSDGTTVDSNYGSTANPTVDVWYPTISKPNGISSLPGVRNLKHTAYRYSNSKIENTDIKPVIFNGNWYWLASRCIDVTSASISNFNVDVFSGNEVNSSLICQGHNSKILEITRSSYAVFPIVTLKSNVIDIDTGYDEANGGWKLK